MITNLRNYKKALVVTAAVVILAVASVVVLNMTKPYAVYADGTKVEDPYVVKAGDEELFLVEDSKTAERVIETVIKQYTPDGAQINSISVDKELSVDNKSLSRGEKAPTVLTEEEAVNYILEENSQEDPLFSVTINAEIGSVEKVEAGTQYEDSDELYKGQSEVKSEGSDGDQIVTNEITSVNGAVLTSQVIDTALLNESVDTVVYKGLTDGADCSGFVQSVYAQFGISLPRTVGPQSNCGKGVSYSEAQPGDLICYSGHIAIYIGGGNIVHAANSRSGINVSTPKSYGAITTVRRIIE